MGINIAYRRTRMTLKQIYPTQCEGLYCGYYMVGGYKYPVEQIDFISNYPGPPERG